MPNNNFGELIIYSGGDGPDIEVRIDPGTETVWLPLNDMARLFGIDKSGISRHLKNIFSSGELDKRSVVAKNATTADDGKTYDVEYYNLDAIISVGYRVNSLQGTRFRIWATTTLREYMVKGFVLDDERLKGTKPSVFDELLERIRSIRTSEANYYRKINDIFSTSSDYDRNAREARTFFATVQNKFHFAITGKTAAQLKFERADASKDNMGMTVWKGPVITAQEAQVAKNYLNELDLKRLELLSEQFLSYAELQATERKLMTMQDWLDRLDAFLEFNEREVLLDAGNISAADAKAKVLAELAKYKERQQIES